MARVSKAVVDAATAKVAANPRGAPITEAPTTILDDQPSNSVLVVLQYPGEPSAPWLQTPAGKVDVPTGDLAWTLPLHAEIKKVGPERYEARQRDDPFGHPVLVTTNARDAITQFKKHFHDAKD